ncbi:hypothetical protein C8233_05485 [Halomonas sp. SF2003]|nr:hypothetical protein C8233_05485 [Halomonas sp. SF2003]
MTPSSGSSDALYGAPRPRRSQRAWWLLATVVVLAFELTLLWLARTPRVDDHYRRYFIEHATTCYRPMGEVPVLTPGERYPIRKGEPLGNCGVLWAGFYSPQPDVPVSARLAEVTLRLRVAPEVSPAGSQAVVVALELSRFPDSAAALPVEVMIGEQTVTHWPVGGRYERFEVEVPAALIASDGSFSLTLKGPPPIAPRDAGLDANKFPVGLRLDALTLRSPLGLTPARAQP